MSGLNVRRWLINSVFASELFSSAVRVAALRRLGVQVHPSAVIKADVKLRGDVSKIRVDDGVYINSGCAIFGSGGVRLRSRTFLGPNVVIITGTHVIGGAGQRAATPTVRKSVDVGAGTWIGEGVLVQPGTTIGSGCVVAARSVVTADCVPDSLYRGTPAKKVRNLAVSDD